MKKIKITVILLFITIGISAQFKLGGKLAYGTKIESLGIGAKAIYPINDKLTASGELNYFFRNTASSPFMGSSIDIETSTNLVTLNTDLHYNLLASSFDFYALGGLNFSIVSTKSSSSVNSLSSTPFNQTFIGLNVGIGGSIPINRDLDLFSELKYIASDFNQLLFSAGVLYSIN